MNWNVGTKIAAKVMLSLTIVIVIGVVAYSNIIKMSDAAVWRSHSRQVLEKIEDVISTTKDAETGQRGFVLTGEERYLEPYTAARASMDSKLKGTDPDSLRSLTKDNESQQRHIDTLDTLINGKDGKFAELQETIELRRGGKSEDPGALKDRSKGFDAALKVVLTDRGKSVMDEIRKTVDAMRREELDLLKKRTDEAQASVSTTINVVVFGTIAAIFLQTLAGILLTRDISIPLKNISATAERVASGDLSVTVAPTQRSDEVGVLENTFAIMIGNLQRLTLDIREGIGVLGSSANEIAASTTQFAASASESASAVSETSTTVEEVRQTAQVASQKARNVSDSANTAARISQSGRKSTEDVAAGMTRIRQQMESIASSMMRLSEQSVTIGLIIATVEDLSTQSNLLAVNAAIEAAKAGEHGKGFGVVAIEVRNLAEQSRRATNQVRTILSDIQKATAAAVLATEQGSKAVEAGAKQTEAAGESIQALAVSVNEAAQAATQIAASSQQQLVGVDQVASAMDSIKQASSQNVASAKQLEVAALNLNDLGQRLKDLVDRYKLDSAGKFEAQPKPLPPAKLSQNSKPEWKARDDQRHS